MIALVEFWSLLESFSDLYPQWKIWKILKKVIKEKGKKNGEITIEKERPEEANTELVS